MKFYIYQGVGTDGELKKVAEVENKKEYIVTGLTANSTYRFAVSSYNGLRESAKSNVITVKTSAIPVQSITSVSYTHLDVYKRQVRLLLVFMQRSQVMVTRLIILKIISSCKNLTLSLINYLECLVNY